MFVEHLYIIFATTIFQYNFAADIYEKLEDYFSLVALYTETHQWEKV